MAEILQEMKSSKAKISDSERLELISLFGRFASEEGNRNEIAALAYKITGEQYPGGEMVKGPGLTTSYMYDSRDDKDGHIAAADCLIERLGIACDTLSPWGA